MADKLVELGLKDLGYVYVNIDDCWLAHDRDPVTQKLVPDPERFPSGIKALSDYVSILPTHLSALDSSRSMSEKKCPDQQTLKVF